MLYVAFLAGVANQASAFYNPGTGRWINKDPIEESGGVNLYGMLNNNPVDFLDYLGLSPVLSYANIVKPSAGNCGNAVWTIAWNISGSSSGYGTIRQIGSIKYDIRLSDGTKVKTKDQSINESWIWRTGADMRDPWSRATPATCTKGKITYKASAKFWDDKSPAADATPNQPSEFPPFINYPLDSLVTHVGGGKPGNWFSRTSNTVTRTMIIKWDCTKGKAPSVITVK